MRIRLTRLVKGGLTPKTTVAKQAAFFDLGELYETIALYLPVAIKHTGFIYMCSVYAVQ